ncbi:MAG: hypothetical protein GY756_17280 [bacterium]|nr:hypothetical protein [bacterium]
MSIDLGQRGRSVFYLNFEERQDATNTKVCRATQEFTFGNLIESSGDYMVAIERLSVPIQRIPMLSAMTPAITLNPLAVGLIRVVVTEDAFSLKQWIDGINETLANDGINMIFKINQGGQLTFVYDDFANFSLTLHQTLTDLLDRDNVLVTGADAVTSIAGNDIVSSESPIFDRFDQLHKIQVEALGMNITQEIIDTDRSFPILTDILIPARYSIGYTEPAGEVAGSTKQLSIGFATRQRLTYTAEGERRYIVLKGHSPIQNLELICSAIFKDGTRVEIPIPRREMFECKIAFFRR